MRDSFETPLWMINPKEDEFVELSSLQEGKIRTFIIPPANLLYWQLRLFQRQNDNMKLHLWSSYGFNPFGGGVNKLANGMRRFPYRGCLDWSGWDRLLPFLPYVYKLRRDYLINDERITGISEDRIDWVIENTVNSYLIDPQGDVFYKTWGNNSGSGATTADNIAAAELVWIYALCLIDNNTSIDDLINEVEFNLYGDDEQHSVSEKYSLLCDSSWLNSFALRIGMQLKFFHGGYEYPIEKLSFLGFTYRMIGNRAIPRFNDTKILHSLLHTYKRLSLPQYVSKVYALTVLAYGTDVFFICCRFYSELLNAVKTNTDPIIKSAVARGVPTSQYLFAFYTMCEYDSSVFPLEDIFGAAALWE